MTRASGHIVIDKHRETACVVFIRSPPEFGLGHLKDFSRGSKQRPHHSFPVSIIKVNCNVKIKYEFKNIAHEGGSQSAVSFNDGGNTAFFAQVAVLDSLPTSGGTTAVRTDPKTLRGAVGHAKLAVFGIFTPYHTTRETMLGGHRLVWPVLTEIHRRISS